MIERISSRRSIKKLEEKARRSTNTKASATKPTLYNISAAKNNYNKKQVNLFYSNSKCNKENQNYLQMAQNTKNHAINNQMSQLKILQKKNCNFFLQTCEQINKKMSIQYINSLYSDILVQIIYQINTHSYIKKQQICNIGQSAQLKKLRKIQTLKQEIHNSIKQNILLKEKVNKSYHNMTQIQALIAYFRQQKPEILQKIRNESSLESKKKDIIKQIVHAFIDLYNQKQHKLNQLNIQVQNKEDTNDRRQNQITQKQYEEKQKKLEQLKKQLEKQQRINQKYEKEQKYLLAKLYSYQNQGMKTVGSSTTLKIKLNNLQDSIRIRSLTKPKIAFSLHQHHSQRQKQEAPQTFRSLNLSKNNNGQIQRSSSLTNLKKQFGRIKRFQLGKNQQLTMLKNNISLKLLPKITKENLIQKHTNNYFNQIH